MKMLLKINDFKPSKGGTATILDIKPNKENKFAILYIKSSEIPVIYHSKVFKDVIIAVEIEQINDNEYKFTKFLEIVNKEKNIYTRRGTSENRKQQQQQQQQHKFSDNNKAKPSANEFAKDTDILKPQITSQYTSVMVPNQQIKDGFINPYNFINPHEIVPRLKNEPPPPHDKLDKTKKTGKIYCTLTTKSLLFIGGKREQTNASNQELIEAIKLQNNPIILGTSLRGMFRSEYEIITNSCFSIFDKNRIMSYRTEKYASKMKGGRIIRKNDGKYKIEILEPVKIQRYDGDKSVHNDLKYDKNKVYEIKIEKQKNIPRVEDYSEIETTELEQGIRIPKRSLTPDYKLGWFYETSIERKNIDNKKYERFFYRKEVNNPIIIDVSKEIISDYNNLMCHWINDILGKTPNEKILSRHLHPKYRHLELQDGDLVFVQMQESNGNEIEAIFPVMVTRIQEANLLGELLDKKYYKCDSYLKLCPACQLFGWTKEEKKIENIAYKSRIKIESAILKSKVKYRQLEIFTPIGSPQPSTTEFYLSPKDNKIPFTVNIKEFKDKFRYDANSMKLRGRKVYLNHKPKEDEWQANENEKHDMQGQTKRLKDIIEPNTEFSFVITFENLTDYELGGLLWILELEPELNHKIGFAKPFGFGSIKIKIDKLNIESIPERYTELKNSEEVNSEQIIQFKNDFKEWIKNAFSKPFDEVLHIKQFKKSLKELPDLRVHYPRLNKDPKKTKESFKWFVANKKNKKGVSILPEIDFIEQQKLPDLNEP